MKIVFLGTGSTFDEINSNTSILIESKTKMLLDCGFMAVREYWKYNKNPNFLDVIYISHFHADHFFGLVGLLEWMKAEKRKYPLTIISMRGVKNKIQQLIKLGYKTTISSLPFKLNFIEVKSGTEIDFNEFHLHFARMIHLVPNLAIKITNKDKSISYSGDGIFTNQALNMYFGSDLLIHETYTLKKEQKYKDYHMDVKTLLDATKDKDIKKIALVHFHYKYHDKKDEIYEFIKQYPQSVFLPKPGDIIEL